MKFLSGCVFLLLLALSNCNGLKDQALRSSVERPVIKARDAYNRIEAEDHNFNFGTNICNTTDDENGRCLCGVDIGEYVAYYLVDFSNDRRPTGMAIRVSNAYSADETGIIDVFVKNLDSPSLARFDVPFTGSWDTYQTLNQTVTKDVYWTQDVIMTFSSSKSDTVGDMKYSVCNLNWFAFY